MSRLPFPCPALCIVTDRRLCQDSSLPQKIALAVEGGVDIVQLREKDLPGRLLLDLAMNIRRAIDDKALLIINERIDVALLANADGVHLGEEALNPSDARSLVGDNMLIGRSVHDNEGALEAQRQGADYLIAGSVFSTRSHPGRSPQGLSFIESLEPILTIPYLAIGGINARNAADVVRAGASGVAVISAILSSLQPGETACRLKHDIRSAWKKTQGAAA